MATGTASAAKKHKKQEQKRQKLRPKQHSVGKSKTDTQKKSSSIKIKSKDKKNKSESIVSEKGENNTVRWATASEQLSFFINQYQSANSVQLSSLELDCLKERCIAELQDPEQNATADLAEHVKGFFGLSWKNVLCENRILEGQIDPGNPAVLVISTSALRSLEILRELRSLTNECHAAKLFSKHMKIEEQVSVLKNRVNIASGTPSRIKKLIDIEALGMSRLAMVVLDVHTDVKDYSLFSLPQVRDEFWDLYRSYFHQPFLGGELRICLYGPLPATQTSKPVHKDKKLPVGQTSEKVHKKKKSTN